MPERLRILLVGNGGKEHALDWKLSQSARADAIFVVPGNGGTAAGLAKVSDVKNLRPVEFAKNVNVNLVIPGPEAPLVGGIEVISALVWVHESNSGPSKTAARTEGSKAFAKDFLKQRGIPAAECCVFDTYEAVSKYLDSAEHDVVIKASGLAAGKGVLIPTSKQEGQAEIRDVMVKREFGTAGDKVVIEEFLVGDDGW